MTTSLRNGFIRPCSGHFPNRFRHVVSAYLFGSTVKGRKILKTAYFIPVVLSVTVVCQLWLSMYDPVNGIINKLFQAVGMAYRQDWLNSPSVSIIAIAFVNAWQYMGFQFALLYAARNPFQNIIQKLLESMVQANGGHIGTSHSL